MDELLETDPAPSKWAGLAVPLLLLEGLVLACALHLFDRSLHPIAYAMLLLLASLPWFFVSRLLLKGEWKPRLRLLLPLAIFLRLIAVVATPSLSDDLNRYVWEGRIQLAGHNPYLVAPKDPRVARPGDPVWEGVNHKEVPAAYPPVTELFLRELARLDLGVLGVKNAYALVEFLCLLAGLSLLRGMGVGSALIGIQAFCPLVLVELVAEGHNDSLALLFTVLGLAVLGRGEKRSLFRALLVGGFLGLAISSKYLPVLLLPWLLRKDFRIPLVALGVVALSYLPFYPPSGDVLLLFEGLRNYGVRWRGNESFFWLLAEGTRWAQEALRDAGWTHWPVGVELQKVSKLPFLVLFGLGSLLVFVWERVPARAFVLVLAILFVLTPTLHPWYLVWVVPFLFSIPIPGLFALLGSAG
ncbi:MAG TPA: hypothetical protein ENK02_11345, partial [Planctomycetes bacterium]|nr:hypothetical protein [Planctomycetota bacterium]